MKDQIQIACAADDAYLQHLGVMLISLFENNKNNSIHIHLFSASFSKTNQCIIEKIVHSYNQQFSFYDINASDFEGFLISEHISLATYYRIVIPDKLPSNINKIIYLDADIIITKNIEPLWNVKLKESHILGAIPEPGPSHLNIERLDIPKAASYFNAGILFISLENWRKGNTTFKVLQYIKNNPEKIVLWDQDALNACLFDQWTFISPKWNVQTAMYDMDKESLINRYGPEIITIIKHPSIIHFTGASKPWNYLNLHPKRGVYFHYLMLSQWKNFKFEDVTFSKRILKMLGILVGKKRYQKVLLKISSASR